MTTIAKLHYVPIVKAAQRALVHAETNDLMDALVALEEIIREATTWRDSVDEDIRSKRHNAERELVPPHERTNRRC